MTQETNRQWLLAARPVGMVKESDFEFREREIPAVGEGEILVRSEFAGIEPAMRGWMEDRASYVEPVALGAVMRSFNVGHVVESRDPAFQPGDAVWGSFGWQDYAAGKPRDLVARKIRRPDLLTHYLGVLGIPGLTAYFGLFDIGECKGGETVVVSGAAGAVGSTAGQLARIKGCRVIGIAGGPEKCRWVTEDLGFDACIDYKSEKVGRRLSELCPDGIDIFVDNVGGDALDAALARIRRKGRVVLVGGISRYNETRPSPGPSNYMALVIRSARMEGFILFDFWQRFDEAEAAMLPWIDSGQLKYRETVTEGFDKLPRALIGIFAGENIGKQMVRLS